MSVSGPFFEDDLQDVRRAEAPGWLRFYLRGEAGLIGYGSVVVLLVAWELCGRLGVIDPLLTSSPTRILAAAYDVFVVHPVMWKDLRVSGLEFLLGFGGAVVVGIPVGLLAGWYKRVYYLVNPYLSALNATPRIALLPVLILWFGIGIWSKVAIVFLEAVFPIAVNALSGVRTVDSTLIKAGRSFGANDALIFRTTVLQGSLPFILSGLRLGIGRGTVGVIVGELVGATAGVGYFMDVAGSTFQTDKVLLGAFVLMTIGVLLVALLARIEARFDKWRPKVGSADV